MINMTTMYHTYINTVQHHQTKKIYFLSAKILKTGQSFSIVGALTMCQGSFSNPATAFTEDAAHLSKMLNNY